MSSAATAFALILDDALAHHDIDTIEARVPATLSAAELAALPDDRILAAMARRIFSAGFRWSVVDAKWSDIEAAFDGFDVHTVAAYEAEKVAALRSDPRIIRHPGKIDAILANAGRILEVAGEEGSMGQWLARWPEDDVVGLWHAIAKRFSMMGGASGPRFLRSVGRDTFILTPDVLHTLAAHGLYTGKGTGKTDQRRIQDLFNGWRKETGRGYAALSMMVAAAAGPRSPT